MSQALYIMKSQKNVGVFDVDELMAFLTQLEYIKVLKKKQVT